MTVFNDQAFIQIGGQWNENLRRVERPFRGILAGVTFNGLRPLDLAADSNSDGKIKLYGDARKLNNIPFDYKERHPELFTKDAIKLMIDQIYNDKHNGPNGSPDGPRLPGPGLYKSNQYRAARTFQNMVRTNQIFTTLPLQTEKITPYNITRHKTF